MKAMDKTSSIQDFVPQSKDVSFKFPKGSLIRSKSSLTFDKHGCCIVLAFNKEQEQYIVFSQKQQCEWTLMAWVVNDFWVMESEQIPA